MRREDILLLLVFLLYLQGYLFQNVFPALLASMILFYLIYLRMEFSPNIEIEREIDRKLKDGMRAKTRLKVRNLSDKKLKIEVIENLPPGFKADRAALYLNGGEEKKIEYFIMPVRGIFKIKNPTIKTMDLRELYYQDFTADSESGKEIEVYPNLDKIREESKLGETLRFSETYHTLIGLQTLEIDSLREFQPGDERRHIEWKATMRTGELIVKDFLKEREGDVYIILDAGKEMRKGVKSSKIDFAATLTIQLAYALRNSPIGLIVYDDYGIKRVDAAKSRGSEQVEKMASLLKIRAMPTNLIGVKLPLSMGLKIKEESREFIRKITPAIKGRRSFATGLIEAAGSLPSNAFLIFISDITANTNELIKVLSELKKTHEILLLTPNPVMFYDEEKLNKETLIWLYERYKEREEFIKKLSRIAPTFDLGPSDLLETIRRALV